MINFLKRLFCKHRYEFVKHLRGRYRYHDEWANEYSSWITLYINLYECPLCNKRIAKGDLSKLTSNRRASLKLWLKH